MLDDVPAFLAKGIADLTANCIKIEDGDAWRLAKLRQNNATFGYAAVDTHDRRRNDEPKLTQ